MYSKPDFYVCTSSMKSRFACLFFSFEIILRTIHTFLIYLFLQSHLCFYLRFSLTTQIYALRGSFIYYFLFARARSLNEQFQFFESSRREGFKYSYFPLAFLRFHFLNENFISLPSLCFFGCMQYKRTCGWKWWYVCRDSINENATWRQHQQHDTVERKSGSAMTNFEFTNTFFYVYVRTPENTQNNTRAADDAPSRKRNMRINV